ncbi:hypothetical protein SAMN02745975_01531 [Geosporobacter subterraneus DSM 17957]|uniref:Uncharacterized protein n=1 Tax=Geosporobacter subterraneus DSM 17957 TaxID=1121919 RepID=A0A1M6HFB3_9FIRM|nr:MULTISPECIES: DUF6674 family protein [Clostridia]SHJ20834.1 hypothetical protein SAMN02745975_01531 [Geosporobacter subterraneus DSM 17957]
MNDTTTQSAPLLENEHVKELLAILKENSVSAKDFLDVIGYVGAMERQLDAAVGELSAMRRELADMREEKNHPVRTSLQKAIQALENKITETRERLEAVKAGIIEGCKNAVAAFKEKGIAALDGLASLFHIRQGLEKVQESMDRNIRYDEQSMKKIAAVSAEYHEIGRHVKNMGRAVQGKEAIQEAKPMGKLAKLIQAPYRLDQACSTAIKRQAASALDSLGKLEQRSVMHRENQKETGKNEKKPSILKNLQALKEQAAQTAQNTPAPQRKKAEVSL